MTVAEGPFIAVERKLLSADMVVGPKDRPLHQGECAFDRIGVNVELPVPPGVLALAVDDLLVLELLPKADVSSPIVRHQLRAVIDVLLDEPLQGRLARIRNRLQDDVLATLHDPHDRFLRNGLPSFPLLASNKGLVGFHDAAEGLSQIPNAQGVPDPVAHEPGAFVADSQHPVELVCGDALLARGHQEHRGEPAGKGDVSGIHEGAGRDVEEPFATSALVGSGFGRLAIQLIDLRRPALGAHRSIRPSHFLQEFAAG